MKPILAGRRVVDLGCHDGRWSFAALKAGATHVTGIEARVHLLRKAEQNFNHYGVPADTYRLVSGEAVEALRGLKAGNVDVVLCLGFFYHTLEHMRLLLEARRLGAEYVIVDTSISPCRSRSSRSPSKPSTIPAMRSTTARPERAKR